MAVVGQYEIPGEDLRLEMLDLGGGHYGFHLFRREAGKWVRRAEYDTGAYSDLATAEAAAARLVPGFAEVLFADRHGGRS